MSGSTRPSELLGAIFERASNAFLVADDAARYIDANPAALDLTGYTLEELRTLSVQDLTPAERRNHFAAAWTAFLRSGASAGEYVLTRKDGSLRNVEFRAVPHVLPGRHLSILTDVTERRQAEALAADQLRASQERLSMALAIAQIGTFELDFESERVIVDRRGREMYGWEPEAEITLDHVQGQIHPDDRPRVVKTVTEAVETDGAGEFDVLQRIIRADGKERWIHAYGQKVGDTDRCIGTYVDVTDQRRGEELLRAQNEELERRVEARTRELQAAVKELESFAHSVSHDLRSPIRTIDLSREFLLEELGPDLPPEAARLFQRQATAVGRMNRLIDALLEYAKLSHQDLSPEPLDLSDLATRAWREITRDAPETGLRLEVDPGMTAEGDPTLLRFLYQNLLQNAIKFSPHGGTVRAGRTEEGAFYVKDEGVGFDMAHAKDLFKPFHRLVRESEFPGTGLGLANVKRIVERHHGQIQAHAEPQKGATFTFTLG